MGSYLKQRLHGLGETFDSVTNVRGEGLMCAFELPDGHARDAFLDAIFEQRVIMLGCGVHSIRFRPPLTITKAHVDQGMEAIETALRTSIGKCPVAKN